MQFNGWNASDSLKQPAPARLSLSCFPLDRCHLWSHLFFEKALIALLLRLRDDMIVRECHSHDTVLNTLVDIRRILRKFYDKTEPTRLSIKSE